MRDASRRKDVMMWPMDGLVVMERAREREETRKEHWSPDDGRKGGEEEFCGRCYWFSLSHYRQLYRYLILWNSELNPVAENAFFSPGDTRIHSPNRVVFINSQ